ncbi:unnamed protein product [Malus baccata var. baccata]
MSAQQYSYNEVDNMLVRYGLFDYFNGESQCPPKYCITPEGGVTKEITQAYKQSIHNGLALHNLLIATLSDETMDYVI